VFGLGFGEILILLVVGIVVIGPKNLPTMMRTAGKWVSKLRRMSTDMRAQSGIDDLIRTEGLEREIQEIRSLSRVNVIDTLMAPAIAASTASLARPAAVVAAAQASVPMAQESRHLEAVIREREYPAVGCDAYGALSDDTTPYMPDEALAGDMGNDLGSPGEAPTGAGAPS
jgi:sec-independent protein translocase protein TatB